YIHIAIRLARFPDQGALHQKHPGRRTSSPLHDGRRDDGNLQRYVRGLVIALDCSDQGSRRTLALEIVVIVREILDCESQVCVTEECFILVAVEIECGGDDGTWARNHPHARGKLSLGPWHAAHRHGAVEAQIDAVEWTFGRKAGQHAAHQALISLGRDPPGPDTGFGPERRLDTDKFDPVVLP